MSSTENVVEMTVAEEAEHARPPVVSGKKESKGTLVYHQVIRARFTSADVADLYQRIPIAVDKSGSPTARLPPCAPGDGERADKFMNRFEVLLRLDLGIKNGMFCFEADADSEPLDDGTVPDPGYHCHLMVQHYGTSADRTAVREWFDCHQRYDVEAHSFVETDPDVDPPVGKQVSYHTNKSRSDYYKHRVGYAVKQSTQAVEANLYQPPAGSTQFDGVAFGAFTKIKMCTHNANPDLPHDQFDPADGICWLKSYLAWQHAESSRMSMRKRKSDHCLITGSSGDQVMDDGNNTDIIVQHLVELIDNQTIRNYPGKINLELTQVYRLLNCAAHRRAAMMWIGLSKESDMRFVLLKAASMGQLFYDKPKYPLTDFNGAFIKHVAQLAKTKCVLICGPSQICKSAAVSHCFPKPIVAARADELKRLDPSHDCVILDDFDFTKKIHEQKIHMLSYERQESFGARFADAAIPPGMPRIIVSNKRGLGCFFTNKQLGLSENQFVDEDEVANKQQVSAVKQRLVIIDLYEQDKQWLPLVINRRTA